MLIIESDCEDLYSIIVALIELHLSWESFEIHSALVSSFRTKPKQQQFLHH